jgi:hypothetical protein
MKETKTNNSIKEQDIISSVSMFKEVNFSHTESVLINEYVKINLDIKEYSSKPAGYEIGVISKRIVDHPTEISIEELSKEIVKGKTFTPACFKTINREQKRSNDYWASQQVFALDFDQGLTIDEALKDKFFQTNAAFLYTTFSHTEEHHKFRIVFVLDEEVKIYKDFESVMNKLLELYPYADNACKDGSRLFFGGKKAIPFNYENRLILDEIIDRSPLQDIKNNLINMSDSRVQQAQPNFSNNNVQLIKAKDIKRLQDNLDIKSITLSSNEVTDYLKKQDLRLFLGISTTGNFIDIFHDEVNPSASIYQSKKGNGHWLYKCFSSSYPFVGTIIHVAERLLHCTTVQAKKFLMEVYKITIYESKAVKEFKESIDIYKELLRSDELEEIHPNFYKVFNRYGHLQDLYMLLDLTKEFITNDSDPRIVFFHSIRTLAKHFGRSVPATGTRLNFLTLFNVTKKLDESEIPDNLLSLQNNSKRAKHYQYRNSTYELPMYTYDFFCQIDDLCKEWLQKGCTSRTISYEGIMRTFGRKEADRVFPQDMGKEIAELNGDIVSAIHYTTMKLIEHKGWTTEKEVLECLSSQLRTDKAFKIGQFKRCIGEMLDAYELEIISTNKRIKANMGITEEFMNKQSFPKIIRPKK